MAITIGAVTIRAVPTAAARAKRAFLILAVLAGIVIVAPYATASDSSSVTPADTWTIAEGETLWSIATMYTEPGDNVRDTLDDIMAMNALDSTAIRAGDQILVPALG